MEINHIELVSLLLQQMCVYLVIAYLLSRTPLFTPLMQVSVRLPHKIICYVMFSGFCILGTYFGLQIQDAIANTRAIGAVLGGLLGGPVVGLAVGLTGGLHRYSLGGFTDLACAISTTLEGLLGGLAHRYLVRRGHGDLLFNTLVVFAITLLAEIVQMAVILLVAKPYADAERLVQHIALPMVIANSTGAAMFMRIILDRKAMFEKYSIAFSAKALRIAERTVGVLLQGLNQHTSQQIAQTIYEEIDVGAVAITDREVLLGFIGIGDDHHRPGTPITSPHTMQAIADNVVVYADGNEHPYRCSIAADCRLGSSLVIPLRGEDEQVIGTIKLYEPKRKLFSSINRTLGEGIARLLSNQLLAGRLQQQKQMLAQTEIKLLHAQVNPHFLFNALNTIAAVIRRNPQQARDLVQYLSTFFRKNLKRVSGDVSLHDEIEHVTAYLKIELARFADRLQVEMDIPSALHHCRVPAFILQPIVENAIKHGTAHSLETGHIRISARQTERGLFLAVEDNAGLFCADKRSDGLGMSLVDKRIKARYGEAYGVSTDCEPERRTCVTLHLPRAEETEECVCSA